MIHVKMEAQMSAEESDLRTAGIEKKYYSEF
jgi:hypothetical protein